MDGHHESSQGPNKEFSLNELRRRPDTAQKRQPLDVIQNLFKRESNAQLKVSAEANNSFYQPSGTEKSGSGLVWDGYPPSYKSVIADQGGHPVKFSSPSDHSREIHYQKSYEGDEQERLLQKLELPLERQKKIYKQIQTARAQERRLEQRRKKLKLEGHTNIFETAKLTAIGIWRGLLEMHFESTTKEISFIQERIDDLQAFDSKHTPSVSYEMSDKYGGTGFIIEKIRQNVSSQKLGAEKTHHSDGSRSEAPSFPDYQGLQTTLSQNIEKENSDYWSEDMYLDHIRREILSSKNELAIEVRELEAFDSQGFKKFEGRINAYKEKLSKYDGRYKKHKESTALPPLPESKPLPPLPESKPLPPLPESKPLSPLSDSQPLSQLRREIQSSKDELEIELRELKAFDSPGFKKFEGRINAYNEKLSEYLESKPLPPLSDSQTLSPLPLPDSFLNFE